MVLSQRSWKRRGGDRNEIFVGRCRKRRSRICSVSIPNTWNGRRFGRKFGSLAWLICLIHGRRGIHWQTKAEGGYVSESFGSNSTRKIRVAEFPTITWAYQYIRSRDCFMFLSTC